MFLLFHWPSLIFFKSILITWPAVAAVPKITLFGIVVDNSYLPAPEPSVCKTLSIYTSKLVLLTPATVPIRLVPLSPPPDQSK